MSGSRRDTSSLCYSLPPSSSSTPPPPSPPSSSSPTLSASTTSLSTTPPPPPGASYLCLSPLLPCVTDAAQASLLCSSNGLLYFFLPNSFLILNLLTKSSRVISFPYYPFGFEIFSLISTHAGYNLFMISSGSLSKSTLLYDSKAQSWQKFNFSETVLSNNCQEKGVYFKGCLYFVTPEPFSIVCFELESGKWERPIPELPA